MSIPGKFIIFFSIILILSCGKKPQIVFSAFSPEIDLAHNSGYSLYPNPLESDKGWGGAPFKWHLVDGLRTKANYWNYGLAFTGGMQEYIDTCGWRQATINFGRSTKFNRVVIWINRTGVTMLPDSFKIMHWSDQHQKWELTKNVTNMTKRVESYCSIVEDMCRKEKVGLVVPYEETFTTVKSSKVRFLFYNCGIDHGWINEFEVYCDSLSEQNRNLVIRH